MTVVGAGQTVSMLVVVMVVYSLGPWVTVKGAAGCMWVMVVGLVTL